MNSDDLLLEVLRYRLGLGKYNFSGYSDSGNHRYDAWTEIEVKINEYFIDKYGKKDFNKKLNGASEPV